MCNINIILTSDDFRQSYSYPLLSYLQSATSVSYDANQDSEGAYIRGAVIRSKDKINYLPFDEELKQEPCIITHQRIATAGKSIDYAQPFRQNGFIMVHNGHLNEYVEGTHSDTHILFNRFCSEVAKEKELSRESAIIKALKTLLDGVSGSYSIAVYDESTKLLYYLKNGSTWMFWYRTKAKDALIMSTTDGNKAFLSFFPMTFKESEPKDHAIYRISVTEKVMYSKIGELKEAKPIYATGATGYGTAGCLNPECAMCRANRAETHAQESQFTEAMNRLEAEEARLYYTRGEQKPPKDLTVITGLREEPCATCKQLTTNIIKELCALRMCTDCLEEIKTEVYA